MKKLNSAQRNFLKKTMNMNLPQNYGGYNLYMIVNRILSDDGYRKGNLKEMEKINELIKWYKIYTK